jgi:PAS domain S-box-containing protein
MVGVERKIDMNENQAAVTQDDLRTSELRYRRLFEAAQDGILIVDATTGMIVDVNPFLIDLLGCARDVFWGKKIWELGFFKHIVASESAFHALNIKDSIHYDDLPLETADGRRIEVELVIHLYRVNELQVMQCNIHDISERKRAELKMRAALAEAQRFRATLDHVPAFVFMKDPQFRYIYANRPTLDLFGCSATELVGCDDNRFFSPDTVQRLRAVDTRVFRGESTQTEMEVVHESGGRRVYWEVKAPLYAESGSSTIVGLIGISTDITEHKLVEEALRASENKFHTLYTSMTEGVALHELVCDASGTPMDYVLLDVNPAFEWLTGLRRDAVIGHTAREVFGGAAPYLEIYAEVARTGRPTHFETKYEPMQKVFTISVFSPAKGRFATVFADITEHELAENALRSSETQFRAMFETASIGMAQTDPMTGQWLRVNQKMCEITGYSESELLQMSIEDLNHPDDKQKDAEAFHRVVRGETPDYRLEKRYLRKGGSVAWVNVNMTVIRDADGHPVRTMATIEDISERKRAMESQVRLVTAVEQAAETIVITDLQGSIEYVNPVFEKITGYSRAEALGQNPRLLKSERHDAEFYRSLWATLTAGRVWNGHFINKRKDGTLYEEEATISPVLDAAGKIVNYVAVKRDVTHEVLLENQLRQAQKMEAVGRLAGGVAHDFNNLLMGIMGYVEICRDQIETGHRAREWLDEIKRCAERSVEITRQLLAFARKQTIAPKIFDLNAAVAGMLKLLRRLIGEDVELVWQPAANLCPVKMDPSQVDQILANLCVNARDAIAGVGSITLETGHMTMDAEFCAAHPGATPGEYVSLTVRDDGCGMDKETLARYSSPSSRPRVSAKAPAWGWPRCTVSSSRTMGSFMPIANRAKAQHLGSTCIKSRRRRAIPSLGMRRLRPKGGARPFCWWRTRNLCA